MTKSLQDPLSGKRMYEIRVEGQLSPEWASWLDGCTIEQEVDPETGIGITVISGSLPDQPALHGLLNKIRDLNLILLSCIRK